MDKTIKVNYQKLKKKNFFHLFLKIWDLNDHQLMESCEGHTNNIFALLTFYNTLYSGSWDKTIKIWQ